MTFRIADLQSLLTNCGRSRSGRKHELLGRALSLLKTNDSMRTQVKQKILEIHNQRYPTRQIQAPPMHSVPSYHNQPASYVAYSEKDDDSYLRGNSSYKHGSVKHGSISSHTSHTTHANSGSLHRYIILMYRSIYFIVDLTYYKIF